MSVFLLLGAANFFTEALRPESFLIATLAADVFSAAAEVGATNGFAASAAKAPTLILLVIKPAINTDKNLFN